MTKLPARILRENKMLQNARVERNLTQQQLADAVGTNKGTVGRWERGYTQPSLYYRQKLSHILEKSPEELGFFQSSLDLTASPGSSFWTKDLPHPLILDPAIPPKRIEVIGRSSLLDRLRQLLVGEPSLCALYGLPGVGKTTLAMALTYDPQIRRYFSEGILWASLGPHLDLSSLLARWSNLLDVEERPGEEMSLLDRMLAIRKAIGEKAFLIVLDDLWHSEAAQLLQIGGGATSYLITTRSKEIALLMVPEQERTLLVPELGEQDSLALLRHIAPGIVEEEEETKALVQAVGGLPLALTLVGQHLRVLAHDHQSRRISRALGALRLGKTRLNIAQSPFLLGTASKSWGNLSSVSLNASVDLSVHNLDSSAQQMLTALALFPSKPNSFSEEAAVAVSGRTPDLLDHLTDANLVEVSGSGRYTIHQIVADYARHRWQLLPQEQRQQMLQRLFTHFKTLAALDFPVEDAFANLLALIQEMDREELISEDLVSEVITILQSASHRHAPIMHDDTEALHQKHLLRLLKTFSHHRDTFVSAITKVIPDFEIPLITKRDIFPEKLPFEFLLRLLETSSNAPHDIRFLGLVDLIFLQVQAIIDPKRMGIHVIVALCSPPASSLDHVQSLRDIFTRQTYSGMFQTTAKGIFRGTESLAGVCVQQAKAHIIQNVTEERRFSGWKQDDLSAAAFPICRAGSVAGCFVVTSPQPHFFTPQLQNLLQIYAHLLPLAFESEQFYPLNRLGLQPMPPKDIQRKYIEQFQERVVLLLQQDPSLMRPQAETKAWQQIEEALLQVALSSESSQDRKGGPHAH